MSLIESVAGRLRKGFELRRMRTACSSLRCDLTSTSVVYLTSRLPAGPGGKGEVVTGGEVKLTYLQQRFPHRSDHAGVAYVVSSLMRESFLPLVRLLKEKGLRIVLNQNGFYFRAWYGSGWERRNILFEELHALSDFVVYQSQFCEYAAHSLISTRAVRSRVVINPVDTKHFAPNAGLRPSPEDRPVLFAVAVAEVGWYRLETALVSLMLLNRAGMKAQLVIAGYSSRNAQHRRLLQRIDQERRRLGLSSEDLLLVPPYTREQAPEVLNRCHVLVHPKFNDASPNLVGEAQACGLAVVYSRSGGTPELVGPDAGIGIPSTESWDELHAPSPEQVADAVTVILNDYRRRSLLAREWAVTRFSVESFLNDHEEIFSSLLEE